MNKVAEQFAKEVNDNISFLSRGNVLSELT